MTGPKAWVGGGLCMHPLHQTEQKPTSPCASMQVLLTCRSLKSQRNPLRKWLRCGQRLVVAEDAHHGLTGAMSRSPSLPRRTSDEYVFPQPDAEGIARVQEIYLNKCDKTLSEAEAREVLSRVMRYLYLLNFTCSTTVSTPENPTTTAR